MYLLHLGYDIFEETVDSIVVCLKDKNKKVQEENVKIYIHAISGCINNNAMRLFGKVGTYSVKILVNSKSAHYFLDHVVVQAT